jgi:hypothetical protein
MVKAPNNTSVKEAKKTKFIGPYSDVGGDIDTNQFNSPVRIGKQVQPSFEQGRKINNVPMTKNFKGLMSQ